MSIEPAPPHLPRTDWGRHLLKPYEQLLADMQAIQRESEQKVAEAFKRHARDVWSQLTPAQREELRQLQSERAARRAAHANSNQ